MEDLISIIIPVYQVQEYLRQCLDSVVNQTYRNIEIILVDDGSTDQSGNICDEYAMDDTRIKVVHKKNGGLVSARKAGLNIASGNLIAYVDSDDYIDEDMYQNMYDEMSRYDADIVITGHTEISDSEEKSVLNYLPEGLYENYNRNKVYQCMLYEKRLGYWGISPACWDKLFKREIMYDLQMKVNEQIWDGEDHAFTYAAILNAKKIVISNHTNYKHRIRPNSVATGYDSHAFERLGYLFTDCKKQFEGSAYWEESLKEQFPYWFRWFLYKHIYTELGISPIPLSSEGYGFVFPFELVNKGEKILLYGAGDVGRDYYRQIITTGYCTIAGWTSADWKDNMFASCLISPEKISSVEFDKVVIAVCNSKIADAIKDTIIKKMPGLKKDKIIWRNPEKKLLL